MAQQLQNLTIAAPGFFGINTQDSPIGIDPAYASIADNCVIDQFGRVGARQGYELVTTNGSSVLGTSRGITGMLEYISRANVTTVFSVGNLKIFTGTTTLVECTLPAGYTITDDDWKIISFNDDVYFFQDGHPPLESVQGSTTLVLLVTTGGGTNQPPPANEALAAYGRIWAADLPTNKYTVYWSDLLNGSDWHGNASGSLDLTLVWPNGYDEVVALAEHNNFLLIFGKKNILVYTGADNPNATTFQLHDTIEGTGCIARDSIQSTGTDLLFLSTRGLMSLGRLIQEKSLPLRDVSRNVRTDLLNFVATEEQANGHRESIKSIYSPIDAFYLLTLPDSKVVYCFDVRQPLENGAFRVTTWTSLDPVAFCMFADDTLQMGHSEGIVKYKGYLDGTDTYQMRYFSNPSDFGNASNLKFLKKFNLTIIGAYATDITLNWGYDYTEAYTKQVLSFGTTNAIAEYGIAKYGIAEYSGGVDALINTPSVNTGGSGSVVTIGLEAQVNGTSLSIQKIDIHALMGRLI